MKANPSVTTVNQTPAKFSLKDEISINTGVFFDVDNKIDTLKDAFSRNEYGINIEIIPTVHLASESVEDDETNYVTLDTSIEFDTVKPSTNARPDVTKRQIKNTVRIADGQTLILGGLKSKQTQNEREKVPFIGELPGIGKLFGLHSLVDIQQEMFIFLTPRILSDPEREQEKMLSRLFQKRPGESKEFLDRLEEAKNQEKRRLFESSFKLIFG